MKKLLTFVLLLSLTTGFSQAKKYVLLEHFTNTYCSICASQNPGFYQNIAVETNTKIHHISIHSSVPYSQCPFYQANKTEQDARRDFYGLQSTPRVSINGATLVGAGTVTAANIDAAAAGTSPIELKVTETTGTNRIVGVSLKAVGTVTGTFRMYAAVVEKKLSFAANNGEGTHYNVLRKYIIANAGTPSSGFSVVPTTAAQTFELNYTVDATWNAAQTYVVAWIQNETTKEVLNSATRFDVSSATEEPSIDAFVNVSPNPTSGKTTISFTQVTPQYLTVQNAVGQVLETRKLANNAPVELDLSNYASGVLFVKIQGLEGLATKRVVKQ
jgi:hypothetical protein